MTIPFEQLVEAHGETVLRVCRAVVGVDDADDAWSETFLAALVAYPRLAEGANVEAWLVTIAHRKAIDVLRSRTRAPIAVETVPEPAPSPTLPRDEVHELWAAVASLPERQRQAVAYHYFAGLPFAEVAEVIGGTAEAARRASSDGVAALRRGRG